MSKLMADVFKLPWIVVEIDTVIAREDETVKTYHIRSADNRGFGFSLHKEGAEAVCRAVNYHDRLVAALKPMAKEYEELDPAAIIPPGTIVKWTELPIEVFRTAHTLIEELGE